MKKLFSKIDNTSKEPNSYIGKVFVVGRHTVTVEEVLAEGKRSLPPLRISIFHDITVASRLARLDSSIFS